MRSTRQVRITIAVDGVCSIDALNFADASCKAATQEIAALLGGQIDHQHNKPEARVRERCGQVDREAAR